MMSADAVPPPAPPPMPLLPLLLLPVLAALLPAASAEDGSEAWLRYRLAAPPPLLRDYRSAVRSVSVVGPAAPATDPFRGQQAAAANGPPSTNPSHASGAHIDVQQLHAAADELKAGLSAILGILSYLILSYLILSYLILSYLILSYLILSYLIL
eukprot:SAG31_NODE_11875_length_989_cov_11.700000_3_plen_154_part_01